MQKLSDLFEPVIDSMGYELVGVEYVGSDANYVMRVYIDHAKGITVDDCARVSHQLTALLEVEDPLTEAYDLEVSSPGLERPLFKQADFERFKGQRIRIKMAVAQNGRKNYRGLLHGINEQGNIDIEVDNEHFELPFADIKRANLLADF